MQFVGESGIDCGGLTREFFTILCKAIKDAYWEDGSIRHNVIALKVSNLCMKPNNGYEHCGLFQYVYSKLWTDLQQNGDYNLLWVLI